MRFHAPVGMTNLDEVVCSDWCGRGLSRRRSPNHAFIQPAEAPTLLKFASLEVVVLAFILVFAGDSDIDRGEPVPVLLGP